MEIKSLGPRSQRGARLGEIARGRFARDIGGTLGATVVVLVAGAAQSVLVARNLGPFGKGVVALVILLPGVLTPLVSSGFAASLVFFASRVSPKRSLQNATTFGLLASGVALGLVAVLAVTGGITRVFPDLATRYLVVGVALLPAMVLQSVYGSLLMGLGRLSAVNGLRVGAALSTLAVVAYATTLSDDAATMTIAIGLAVVAAAVATTQARLLTKYAGRIHLGWDRELLKQQMAFAAKDHPGAVLQFLNYRMDQLFISGYVGAAGVGVYSVAVTLGELLWLIPDAVATVVFPRSSRERQGEGRRAVLVSAALALGIAALGAAALWIIGGALISVVFSSRFDSAYSALRWLLPGAVCLGPAKILAADLAGRGYPTINSACAGAGLVVTVVLDIALIPSEGIIGAAKASSVAYVFVALLVGVAFTVAGSRQATDLAGSGVDGIREDDESVGEERTALLQPAHDDTVRNPSGQTDQPLGGSQR